MRNGSGPIEKHLAQKYLNDLNNIRPIAPYLPETDIVNALDRLGDYNRFGVMQNLRRFASALAS